METTLIHQDVPNELLIETSVAEDVGTATQVQELATITSPPSKKRKLSEEAQSRTTPPVDNLAATIAPRPPIFLPSPDGLPYFITGDVPMNRQGFRYTPARPSPPNSVLSHRSMESQPAGYVRVSWEDRSPYVRVTADGLGVHGDKGFRSARLNVPVKEGKWYMEIQVGKGGGELSNSGQGSAHVRLGWARREAPLNGPVGMDGYSYGYRDKTGDKVTLAKLRPYGRPFGSGDVIGLYISLPPRRKPAKHDPLDPARVMRKRVAINYKSQLYFESMDYAQSKEMISLMDFKGASLDAPSKKDASVKDSQADKTVSAANRRRKVKPPMPKPEEPLLRPLPTLGPTSCISFFVNGECQGPAFSDLYDYLQLRAETKKQQAGRRSLPAYLRERENTFDDGSLGYYPFVSVFEDARISINSGPDFLFPPPPDIDAVLYPNSEAAVTASSSEEPARTWRPLCERYGEYTAEETAQDELDELEARKAKIENELQDEASRAKDDGRVVKKVKPDGKKASSSKKAFSKKKSGLSNEIAGTTAAEAPAASEDMAMIADGVASSSGEVVATHDNVGPSTGLEDLPGPSTSPVNASFGPIAHGATVIPSPWGVPGTVETGISLPAADGRSASGTTSGSPDRPTSSENGNENENEDTDEQEGTEAAEDGTEDEDEEFEEDGDGDEEPEHGGDEADLVVDYDRNPEAELMDGEEDGEDGMMEDEATDFGVVEGSVDASAVVLNEKANDGPIELPKAEVSRPAFVIDPALVDL
ncbi:hypothetical protein FRB96_002960 [Tulasnella sp. 330]|nr:hypothetical protein FRB96_002960 [Tulasnella sp. 330]KAG8876097.1 hypothetical protein FRB97_004451 [Tulasnella sp. 331]KAG8881673.1 hypothetical protein FRB98_004202 [Tulasnella sp. 332]